MLNEAIIQSLLEQDRVNENVLELPSAEQEEAMMKEVIKMSALEYQKSKGTINLDHLKRRKKKESMKPSEPTDFEL